VSTACDCRLPRPRGSAFTPVRLTARWSALSYFAAPGVANASHCGLAEAQRDRGEKRLSPSTALPPILGASTTSTAMSGNGLRIAGTKRMSETRATARREPMEIAAFAFCAALPGTTIRIPFVRPDATWHRSATGSTTSVFVLPENCDWSMRSAVPGPVGQYCRVWDLARTQTHAGAGVVRFWGGADATAVRPLWGIMTQIRLLARSPGLLLVARHAWLRTVCVLGW
jgi:hypothetical protein